MLENTISIDNETALENGNVQQENAVLCGEEDVLKTAEAASAAEGDVEATGEKPTEENTISDVEDMLTLTVYGDTVTVKKSEAVSAAQRGIAFDRMKEKLAFAKGDARLKALDDLAQLSGKNISHILAEMTKQTLTDNLVQKYGDFENVPFEDMEEVMNKVYTTRKNLEETADRMVLAEKQSQLEEFLQHNPGCTDIPQEVIERARKGENLTLAYSQYQIEQLKTQLETAQQELNIYKSRKTAKEKSMPSAKSTVVDGVTTSMYGMMKSLW